MMKKLDLRTMVIMLVVFALGYAVCLAMPGAKADTDDPVIIDRLMVNDYIEFANGVRLIVIGDGLACDGPLQIKARLGFANGPQLSGSHKQIWLDGGLHAVSGFSTGGSIQAIGSISTNAYVLATTGYRLGTTTIIDPFYILKDVTIDSSTAGGSGLDVGKLQGHSAADFVLKSEIDNDFCQTFCPLR